MSKIIGIDLGTTYSAIASLNDLGTPEVLEDPIQNKKTIPSVVFLKGNNNVEVGENAKRMLSTNPDLTVSEVKKRMHEEVIWSTKEGKWIEKDTGKTKVTEGEFTPAQLSSFILKKVSSIAGETKKVVVTVPALFENLARTRTEQAVKLAGLELIRLIDEPVAAALHYASLDATKGISGKIMIFDLGGGTFDVSIVDMNTTDVKDIKVITSKGDRHIGGTDFDKEICKLLNTKYKNNTGVNLFENDQFSKYLNIAEQIKRVLSVEMTASEMIDGPKGSQNIEISRDEFEKSIDKYLDQISMLLEEVLEVIKLGANDISQILLVGGSTRVPAVVKLIRDRMGKEPTKGVDVDQAVAAGAAIYAGKSSSAKDLTTNQKKNLDQIELHQVCNHYFGVFAITRDHRTGREEERNVIVIPKDTPIPCSKIEYLQTRYDNQDAVRFRITQSAILIEKGVTLVNILKDERLPLPENLPKGEPLKVLYSYDKNGKMHCTLEHEASKRKIELALEPDNSKTLEQAATEIKDFNFDDFKFDGEKEEDKSTKEKPGEEAKETKEENPKE
jgi:molecular chaperone DnaK